MEEHLLSDPYLKQRLSFDFRGHTLLFDTASLLYSPHQIDSGTQLLLQTLDLNTPAPKRVLILTSNYGVVGIALASFYPQAEVVVCDKDLLALRYTRRNAVLNSVSNLTLVPSIGTRALDDQRFDLVVAHIPTKVGDQVIEHDFILAPLQLLSTGRRYWFVTASQLNRLLPHVVRRHRISMTESARQSGHIVYHITKS